MNAIYQLFGKPVFLLALLALLVLTVRVIHGLFHGDRTDLELWILSCGILLSAVLLRFGCGLFTGWFTDDMQKFINSFYSCGVYILLQLFKYLAIGTIYEGGITYGKFEGTDSGIAKIIDTYDNIVFFGGAGVSTESGIPDFRSVDGLYHQQYDYPPETILSHSFYRSHPEEFSVLPE